MREPTFERLKLKITETGDKVKFSLDKSIGKAFKKDRGKIYIISKGKKVVYVGETKRSIIKRLNDSRNAIYRHQFFTDRNKDTELIVSIAVFAEEYNDSHKEILEAIEGEIVYLIRNNSGSWPMFQNEIHFHNTPGAEKLAKYILANLNLTF